MEVARRAVEAMAHKGRARRGAGRAEVAARAETCRRLWRRRMARSRCLRTSCAFWKRCALRVQLRVCVAMGASLCIRVCPCACVPVSPSVCPCACLRESEGERVMMMMARSSFPGKRPSCKRARNVCTWSGLLRTITIRTHTHSRTHTLLRTITVRDLSAHTHTHTHTQDHRQRSERITEVSGALFFSLLPLSSPCPLARAHPPTLS